MRPLFTDGFNSAVHVALGYALGSSFLLPFLLYQYVLKPDVNSTVDSAEYLVGWLARKAAK